MLVKVHIPFTDRVTGELHKVNDEIELTAERLAEVRAVNINMVTVISEEEPEEPKKPRTKKKKAE